MTKTPEAHLPTTFAEAINKVVDEQYGGIRRRLAESMNVSLSFLGKVVNDQWPMGAENVLQFAQISGFPASHCLRIAGHHKLADQIESFWGPEAKRRAMPTWDNDQRELLLRFAHLNTPQRKALLDLMRVMRPGASHGDL